MKEWDVSLRMAAVDGTPSDVEYRISAPDLPAAVKLAVGKARYEDPDLDYLEAINHAEEAGTR